MLKKVIACILALSITLGMCNYAVLADDSIELPEDGIAQEESMEDMVLEDDLPEEMISGDVFEEIESPEEIFEEAQIPEDVFEGEGISEEILEEVENSEEILEEVENSEEILEEVESSEEILEEAEIFEEVPEEDELAALATNGTIGNGISWELISLTDGMYELCVSGNGEIPRFTGPAPWAGNADQIVKITIGTGITAIGQLAFSMMKNVTEVTIPATVVRIDVQAFYKLGITELVIPNSVTTIGNSAFFEMPSLQSITLPFVGRQRGSESTENERYFSYIFGSLPATLRKVVITDDTEIPSNAFQNCSMITELTIADSVVKIDGSALKGCTKLEKLTVPFVGSGRGSSHGGGLFGFIFGTGTAQTNGVLQELYVMVGDSEVGPISAHYSIPASLHEVVITSETMIDYCAFMNCKNITSLSLPGSVTEVSPKALMGCTGLQYLSIPFTGYSENATGAEATLGIVFGEDENGVNQSYAKYGIPESLREVVLTNTATIKYASFLSCSQLTTIDLPDTVTTIESNAFQGCSNLQRVRIPDRLTTVGSSAFYGCTAISEVTCSSLENWIKIHFGSLQANPVYHNHNLLINGEKLTELVVPEGTTSISLASFYGIDTLTSVQLPSTLQTIGSRAFSETGLTEVVIPEGVTAIGENAFRGCASLETITIPTTVTSIYSNAFAECPEIANIYLNAGPSSIGSTIFGNTTANIYYLVRFASTWTSSKRTSAAPQANWISVDTVKSIGLTSQPKLSYKMGEEFDYSQGKVSVVYYSGKQETHTFSELEIIGFDSWTYGEQTITVVYDGAELIYKIQMSRVLDKLEWDSMPKTDYGIGQKLDLTDTAIRVVYTDGYYDVVKVTSSMVTGFSSTSAGNKTLTVKYLGLTLKYVVSVANVASVSLYSLPKKTVYEYGETLKMDGCSFEVIYENGATEIKTLNSWELSGYDETKPGYQTVNIRYSSQYFQFDVFVRDVKEIIVETLPKTAYGVYQSLDTTNGRIKIIYNDETVKYEDMTADMISGFDSEIPGTKDLLVTYGRGFTTNYTVTVYAIDHLEIEAFPYTHYAIGEALNVSGGKVKVFYGGQVEESIDLTEEMITGFDSAAKGEETLTVTYKGHTTSVAILIVGEDSIAIRTLPDKLKYENGEVLDVNGLTFVVYSNDGSEEVLDADSNMIIGYDAVKPGVQTLTLLYHGMTTTYDVFVRTATEIQIVTLPEKVTYLTDQPLDVTGGTLEVTYNDDTKETVAIQSDMVTGYVPEQAGAQTLTVTYKSITATFEVYVAALGTAIVTADAVSYKTPKIDDNKFGFVEEGQKVTVTSIENDFYLLSNGQYVQMQYIYVLGTPEPDPEAKIGQGTTTVKTTIYAEPSTNSESLGTIGVGSIKNLYAQSGNWYQIYSNKRFVWVHASAFNFTQAATTVRLTTAIITATSTIHVGPGSHFQSAGTINEGRTVNVYEIRNGWYKVYSGGKYVWVDGNYCYDTSTPDPDVSAKIGQGMTTKKVTIYSQPDANSQSVGTIAVDKVRNLYAQSGNWYQIYVTGLGFVWVRCDGFDFTVSSKNVRIGQKVIIQDATVYYGHGTEYLPVMNLKKYTVVNYYDQNENWFLVYKNGKYDWIESSNVADAYILTFDTTGSNEKIDKYIMGIDDILGLPSLTSANPSKSTFVGWNTKKDGSGESYSAGDIVTNMGVPGEIVTLYAQWKLKGEGTSVSFIPDRSHEYSLNIEQGNRIEMTINNYYIFYTVYDEHDNKVASGHTNVGHTTVVIGRVNTYYINTKNWNESTYYIKIEYYQLNQTNATLGNHGPEYDFEPGNYLGSRTHTIYVK